MQIAPPESISVAAMYSTYIQPGPAMGANVALCGIARLTWIKEKPDPRGLVGCCGSGYCQGGVESTSLAVPLDASNAAFHGKDSHSLELVLYLSDYAKAH
jgi:hypothetical protein